MKKNEISEIKDKFNYVLRISLNKIVNNQLQFQSIMREISTFPAELMSLMLMFWVLKVSSFCLMTG